MCVVSAVGDQWGRQFPDRWPQVPVYPQPYVPVDNPMTPQQPWELPHEFEMLQDGSCEVCGFGPNHPLHTKPISREDFDALKREMEELRELLLAAKRFDEATGQADCEMDEKVELIRRVAELVGVDVDEVFGKNDDPN